MYATKIERTRANRTVAFSNSASPETIWGLGGPEEDHQLNHCCWTGRVSEREEEETGLIQCLSELLHGVINL